MNPAEIKGNDPVKVTAPSVKGPIVKGDGSSNGAPQKIKTNKIKNAIGIFFLVLALLLFLYYVKGLVARFFFSFDKVGSDFDQSTLYKLHLSTDDFGIKRNDYIDFDYVIRTGDASADCGINGRYNVDGLEYVEADGSGDICESLNYERN